MDITSTFDFGNIEVTRAPRKILIKYFEGAVKIEKIQKGDWIDLRANEDVALKKGDFTIIKLGVAMKLPDGYEAHIAPRSSTTKKFGIIQANSVGVVDNSYSGPNDQWGMPVVAVRDTEIHRGDRICQFRIMEVQPAIEFVESDLGGNADRGGFGSTGTK